MSAVHELKLTSDDDEPPVPSGIVKEVVGTAVGLTIGLADDRQMTLQTGYAEDEPDEVVNARLDRTMRFADRLKARYEIASLCKELADLDRDLFRGQEALAETDANFEKSVAEIDVQILEAQRNIREIQDSAYARAAGTGRSNAAALKGTPQANIDRWNKGIEDAVSTKARNAAERDQFRDQFVKTQERRQARIDEINGLIADKEVLIKGS